MGVNEADQDRAVRRDEDLISVSHLIFVLTLNVHT